MRGQELLQFLQWGHLYLKKKDSNSEPSYSWYWETNRALRIVGENVSSPVFHSWLELEEEAFGTFALVPLEISPFGSKTRPSVASSLLFQMWDRASLLLRNQWVFNFQSLWPWVVMRFVLSFCTGSGSS